jgi:hypothetical protein
MSQCAELRARLVEAERDRLYEALEKERKARLSADEALKDWFGF